ncbi:MAG: transposase [Gammaproteobacteria bacterium]|nr:transposase [Gammaproteobacteria bacterium]
MLEGLVQLPWWGIVVVALVFTHITIAAVTIFLHRCQAHRALELHPLIAHFFRAWLWLTSGMNTREWTAVHRKHHAAVETEEDPHSPQVHGIRTVMLKGAELYQENASNRAVLERYGFGTPDDWIERHLYTPHSFVGIVLMFIVNVVVFGPIGITIWAVQMIWIPIFAAGIINGAGHWWGYRNFETADASTNIVPWGILIGGEELHNNHHAFASSAKFSVRPWEFDLGWFYVRLMQTCGLAEIHTLAPGRPVVDRTKPVPDFETLKAVVGNRLHVMAEYGRMVVKRVHKEELRNAAADIRRVLKPLRPLMLRAEERLNDLERGTLRDALAQSKPLEVVYRFRLQLQEIYEQRTASRESLLDSLQEWCRHAEATGIKALEDFAQTLRGYTLQPA